MFEFEIERDTKPSTVYKALHEKIAERMEGGEHVSDKELRDVLAMKIRDQRGILTLIRHSEETYPIRLGACEILGEQMEVWDTLLTKFKNDASARAEVIDLLALPREHPPEPILILTREDYDPAVLEEIRKEELRQLEEDMKRLEKEQEERDEQFAVRRELYNEKTAQTEEKLKQFISRAREKLKVHAENKKMQESFVRRLRRQVNIF